MRVRGAGMILCLLVSVAVAGCSGESELAEGPGESPSVQVPEVRQSPEIEVPSVPEAAGLDSTSGRLTAVDPGSMTFMMLAQDGTEMTFRYDASTVVTGVDQGQGLAAQEGSAVEVSYEADDLGSPLALRIEFGAASPAFN